MVDLLEKIMGKVSLEKGVCGEEETVRLDIELGAVEGSESYGYWDGLLLRSRGLG